ncbi:FAD-dependent monooxygenase [Oryzifoliimicrobium ureilyticus]|uniref:FAD-dependent monooxygenase n=1 Tax=Oryzifoliimicrobium ureilyticus TaxID=3113724 RepID=UPI00307634DD
MTKEKAVIVGAGIAGLTAALSLARHGIASEVHEKSPSLSEVGAGLQLSPNASSMLDGLGLLERLSQYWNEPEAIRLVSGYSLREHASVPVGNYARQRWGAPYVVLHRADLQQVLLEAVENEKLCRLHLNSRISEDDIAALSSDAKLVIGADGVWSKVSSAVADSPKARFSGNVAYRFTIPEEKSQGLLNGKAVTAFLGSNAHLVSYPLGKERGINVVAITAGNPSSENWQVEMTPDRRNAMLARFAGWHPGIKVLLEKAEHVTYWPLYERLAGSWHDHRNVVLIGDAAHAMMPFAAQGAAMAIEDAVELARLVAARPASEALTRFTMRRTPRIKKLRQRASLNRFAYHASGPIKLARNIVFSLKSPESLAGDLDWIYGYRASNTDPYSVTS